MARKKKRGPGRPKGSKTKAKRGRPPKAAATKKARRGRPPGSKTKAKRGRPKGSKTRRKNQPAAALQAKPAQYASHLSTALDSLAASFQSIAKSLEHISVMTIKTAEPHRKPEAAKPVVEPAAKAEPVPVAATPRVGAQAQPIPADQGVQAQV